MGGQKCRWIGADIITEIGGKVVLIERKNFPPGWAIPGGFVDFGETVEDAAVREAREEISLEGELRALLRVDSPPDRDPPGQTITVGYASRPAGAPRVAHDAKHAPPSDPRNPP